MTNETSPNMPEREIQPKPGYALAEASLEAIKQEASVTFKAVNNVYESGSDEVKQKIDQFEEDYNTACQQASEKGEALPSLSSFLETREELPDEFKSGILAYEDSMERIESAAAELEKHAPEKAAAVAEQAKELEGRVDYDKVVAAAFADDDRAIRPGASSMSLLYDVSRAIGARKLLEQSPSPEYWQIQSVEHYLAKYTDTWEELGLLKAEGEQYHESSNEPLSGEDITEIETHIEDVRNLRKNYKQFDDRNNRDTTRTVLHLSEKLRETEQPAADVDELFTEIKTIYNKELYGAINKRLVQKLDELPAEEFETDVHSESYTKLVEKAKEIDVTEALENIELAGTLEKLPFEYSEAELKNVLAASVPVIALEAVKRIEFRPMTKEEDEEDTTAGFHRWSEELNGSEIVISDAGVRKVYETSREFGNGSEANEIFAQAIAKRKMQETITHEFAHALHTALPVAALQRWEEQRATDPAHITEYVKYHHDNNHINRYKEDFADTMKLFVHQPAVLTFSSPTRFNAMQQIFEEFMPAYSNEEKKSLERRMFENKRGRPVKDVSYEEIKNLLLRGNAEKEIDY